MKLKKIRGKIDVIDQKIIKLLALRMSYSKYAKISKLSLGLKIRDIPREKEVINKIISLARINSISESLVKKIYKEIMKESRRLQK